MRYAYNSNNRASVMNNTTRIQHMNNNTKTTSMIHNIISYMNHAHHYLIKPLSTMNSYEWLELRFRSTVATVVRLLHTYDAQVSAQGVPRGGYAGGYARVTRSLFARSLIRETIVVGGGPWHEWSGRGR